MLVMYIVLTLCNHQHQVDTHFGTTLITPVVGGQRGVSYMANAGLHQILSIAPGAAASVVLAGSGGRGSADGVGH